MNLSVREIQQKDIELVVDYWMNASDDLLLGMGVDLNKMLSQQDLTQMLEEQLQLPIENKRAYCVIWENDGVPVGHSNTNPTKYREEATMHLHLWNGATRKKGTGTELVKLTLPLYFENLKIKKLIVEPYALNPAPNRTLEKVGFTFIKEYITTPGFINFEQPVKRWEMTREQFLSQRS
jgi:ribosomal-protein-alanine N-acetyltransferase